jgi:hypothetical protein
LADRTGIEIDKMIESVGSPAIKKTLFCCAAQPYRPRIVFDCQTTNDAASMPSTIPVKTMTAGERDKKMDDIATKAATAFCLKPENATDAQIEDSPETYLQHSIPYLTVRTLHRHENALKGLEADSRWIKLLTLVLVILTIVLAIYAWRLDAVIHSLSQ